MENGFELYEIEDTSDYLALVSQLYAKYGLHEIFPGVTVYNQSDVAVQLEDAGG